jgi:hypothetical protein
MIGRTETGQALIRRTVALLPRRSMMRVAWAKVKEKRDWDEEDQTKAVVF